MLDNESQYTRHLSGYTIRMARPEDCADARALMLATFERDFGYGYVPQWHWDVDDLQGVYLDHPRQALFVAINDSSRTVVGTTAVRTGGPKPPHPLWLVERYIHERTAQLVRVYIAPEHRRRGLAQALVEAACRFVADDDSYDVIYLHTDPRIGGAEPFWRAIATREVYSDREQGGMEIHGRHFQTIHFEIDIPSPRAP